MSAVQRVGIVTVTYNSSDVLDEFLASVAAQTSVDVTLYVIDNASTDDSADKVSSAEIPGVEVVLIRSDRNLGVAEGNNVGIRRALADGHDWLLILNNDTEFEPEMVSTLIQIAERQKIDILSPVIEGDDPAGSLWYGGGHTVWWQGYRAFHDGEGVTPAAERVTVDEIEKTDYAPTCCLLVSRKVFETVGEMDPSYFVYYDDVDFNLRCLDAGFSYYVTSRARMLHKAGSVTGRGRTTFTAMWLPRNWALTARRFTRPRILLLIPLLYMQAHLIVGSIVARDSFARVKLRQKSFLAGLRADLDDHSVPERPF